MTKDVRKALKYLAMGIAGVVAILWFGIANAKPIGGAQTEGVGIVLFDDRGSCPAGATRALWVQAEGKVPGCWFEKLGHLWFLWDDGDTHGIDRRAFKFDSV